MRNRLTHLAALVLLVTSGMFAHEVHAANSRSNLPKAKPAQAGEVKPAPPAKAEKPASTDDFKDHDNNGVDDRHEKRAIRSEPAATPTVKQVPKPDAAGESKSAPAKASPPAGKAEEPPPKAPPGL